MRRVLSLAVHAGLMLAAWAALVLLSGCAATLTVALGEHARAAIASPQFCAPRGAPPAAVGERRTVVEDRDGRVGPDDVVTTTTTEPAFAPDPPPLHESTGAPISETGGSVLRTVFGFLGGLARGLFGLFVP